MSVHPPSTTDPPPKTLLYCPECGHASEPTGDWTVSERAGDAVYECPDCGTDIAVRGRSDLPHCD